MSNDDIFKGIPKREQEIIINNLKPEYEKVIDTYCTPLIKDYNNCIENNKKSLSQYYSSSFLFFKKDIDENIKELINYDTKLKCKNDYLELNDCLDHFYKGLMKGLKDSHISLRERFYIYLKYDYIKDLK